MGRHKHKHGIGSERISSATKSQGRDERDIKFQIHYLEAEAYHAVLKAYIAQSDNLTWAREALMTELRRELNITDDEHGELLTKIKSDEAVKMIREWRNGGLCAQECDKGAPRYPRIVVSDSHQRTVETSHHPVLKSQKCSSCSQPCKETTLSAAPDDQTKDIGGGIVKRQRTSTHGNSHLVNMKYKGRLSNDQMLSSVNSRQAMDISCHNPQAPSSNRSTELVKSQLKLGFHAPGSDNFKKSCDMIRIRATDKVIDQVEKMISQERLAPIHIGKAKIILRDHERDILEALSKLPDLSDVDGSSKKIWHKYHHEELPGMGRENLANNDFCGQPIRRTMIYW